MGFLLGYKSHGELEALQRSKKKFNGIAKCNKKGGKSRHEMKIWVFKAFLEIFCKQPGSIDCKPISSIAFIFFCVLLHKAIFFCNAIMNLAISSSKLLLHALPLLSGKKHEKGKSVLDLQTSLFLSESIN